MPDLDPGKVSLQLSSVRPGYVVRHIASKDSPADSSSSPKAGGSRAGGLTQRLKTFS